MQVELKQIQREVGITFVYVTHDQEEALTMSDRIAVMNDGRVAQCGEPEDIYEHPSGEFVAGFIGISNLMAGVVEDGRVRLANGERLEIPLPDDVSRGDSVHLSVRPEKIALDEDIEEGMVTLEGRIEKRVYLGVSTQITVSLGGGAQRRRPRAGHLSRRSPRTAGSRAARSRSGWHPEHCLVLR